MELRFIFKKLEQKCDLGFCTPNQVNMLNHRCTWKLHLNLKELHLKFLSEGQFCTSGKIWKFQDCIQLICSSPLSLQCTSWCAWKNVCLRLNPSALLVNIYKVWIYNLHPCVQIHMTENGGANLTYRSLFSKLESGFTLWSLQCYLFIT
jgi:hypothetical protein